MRAERETVAAERTAEGLRQAAAIRADADREAREVVARRASRPPTPRPTRSRPPRASTARRISADPELYTTLRSLDTINQVVGRNTSLILRTDAAPFRVLVDGPTGAAGGRK